MLLLLLKHTLHIGMIGLSDFQSPIMERAELSDFVVNSSLKVAGSTAPPNLTQHSNYTGSVRSALCERPFKVATKSYHCQSESNESVKHNHKTRVKDKRRNETMSYNSETEKSRAQELGFGNNDSKLCDRAFKLNTQSLYQPNSFMKRESYNQLEKKDYNSETEKSRAWDSGFVCINGTLCNRAFKLNTQSFYPPSSFTKSTDHTHESCSQ